jgi:hypothetical protein
MTVFDVIERLEPLRGMPAALIVVIAAFFAVAVWQIRLAILALAVQYLVSGLLYVEVLDPRLAVAYVLSGICVTMILLITGWQINWGRPPVGLTEAEMVAIGQAPKRRIGPLALTDRAILRIGVGFLALIIVLLFGRTIAGPLSISPVEQPYISLAVTGLVLLGLGGLAVSSEPVPAGFGLLLFMNGFALYYSFLDPSIAMVVALVMVQLLVAVVVSYLAQARFLPVDRPD